MQSRFYNPLIQLKPVSMRELLVFNMRKTVKTSIFPKAITFVLKILELKYFKPVGNVKIYKIERNMQEDGFHLYHLGIRQYFVSNETLSKYFCYFCAIFIYPKSCNITRFTKIFSTTYNS